MSSHGLSGDITVALDTNSKMVLYREEEFYKESGWPPEEYSYCDFFLPAVNDAVADGDYDQFILVVNALYPFIRLSKKRGSRQWPCGLCTSPAIDGWFAGKTDDERDEFCPKIVWGVAAWYLAYLSYREKQHDYVLLKEQTLIFKEYYDRLWNIYKSNHEGLKYANISIEKKESDFLSECFEIEQELWGKSTPLKAYSPLYDYASDAREEYGRFLLKRKLQLEGSMKPNNYFFTEICTSPSAPYIRVFFLDDGNALKVKEIVESVSSVKKVNSGVSKSASHPGQYLIVYIKPMVTAEYCDQEIHETLNLFFTNTTVGKMQIHNEAYFSGIEKRILEALDKACATIDVCVAWFTNERFRDKLLEKQKDGIAVRVIRYHDGVNTSKGVDLYALDHKEVRGERGGLLHDKFCVIDNVHTICGSYNWTLNAENRNDEDATFHFEDYKLASSYTKRFNDIWRRGEIIEE